MTLDTLYDLVSEKTIGPYKVRLVKEKESQRRAFEIQAVKVENEKETFIPHLSHHYLNQDDSTKYFNLICRTVKYMYNDQSGIQHDPEDIEA